MYPQSVNPVMSPGQMDDTMPCIEKRPGTNNNSPGNNNMKLYLYLLLAVLSFFSMSLQAADVALTEDDCREVLANAAANPGSVPQRVVDDCKEMLAAAAVPNLAPAAGGAALAATDPCAGPGAGSSVHCWGPWSALAPAAGAAAALPDTPAEPDTYPLRPELAANFDRELDAAGGNDLPLGSCAPGAPCGFATVVEGTTGSDTAEQTSFARFDIAADGSQFTVAPGETGEIASVAGMDTVYTTRPDEFENLRATGTDGDQGSRMVARVIRDTGGINTAADYWANGNTSTGAANSGFFAWGRAMIQADLDALNNASIPRSLSFSGPMSVDNSTIASITVDFGAQPAWNGTWTNPAYSFGAGGNVSGADFVSAADQFTSNVVGSGNVVQGALLGGPDNRSVAHIIDVELRGIGRIKDVGLLREQIGTPAAD